MLIRFPNLKNLKANNMETLFLNNLKWTEILIIVVVAMLLFGSAKIPKLMRNLGKGVHSFKQGLEDAKEEINKEVRKAGEADETDKPVEKGDK